MSAIWDNSFVMTSVYFLLSLISIVIFLIVFEMFTSYKKWEQIKNGNMSVAMATAGKIFGVANVFRFSIERNESILEILIWGAFGFVMLMLAYFIFEFLTPYFKVDEEIEKDNRAIGILSFVISVATSYVVGASIF